MLSSSPCGRMPSKWLEPEITDARKQCSQHLRSKALDGNTGRLDAGNGADEQRTPLNHQALMTQKLRKPLTCSLYRAHSYSVETIEVATLCLERLTDTEAPFGNGSGLPTRHDYCHSAGRGPATPDKEHSGLAKSVHPEPAKTVRAKSKHARTKSRKSEFKILNLKSTWTP